jgi:hypothetical protein
MIYNCANVPAILGLPVPGFFFFRTYCITLIFLSLFLEPAVSFTTGLILVVPIMSGIPLSGGFHD